MASLHDVGAVDARLGFRAGCFHTLLSASAIKNSEKG